MSKMSDAASDFVIEPDYAGARVRFLSVCDSARLSVESYLHPLKAPDGTALATDVVRIGPTSASRLLVLTSGAHGPELMVGSACQSAWLKEGDLAKLPPDTAVLLVHAINPWGTAHQRRNTEDNVDYCRNWIDHQALLPVNAAYESLHEAATCDPSRPESVAQADAVLARYRERHGGAALYGALMAGQFQHANGLGYGGRAPTWSRRTMESILAKHAAKSQRVCLVDYHTGVGPYGYGSIVALQVGDPLARVRAAFGGWVIAPNEAGRPADFVPVTGHTTPGYESALKGSEVMAVVLEFGTYAADLMLTRLLADHRLTFAPRADASALRTARAEVQRFFQPTDSYWRETVLYRSGQVISQALNYLRTPDSRVAASDAALHLE